MPPITACPHWSDVLGGLPWLGVGQLAPPPASNLTVMGNTVRLPPLPAEQLRLPPAWMSALDPPATKAGGPGVAGLFAQGAAWRRAARALRDGGRLAIAVLGGSITAGCGASEPWEVFHPNGTSIYTKAQWEALKASPGFGSRLRCAPETAWARRFHDELQAVLQPRGLGRGGDVLATSIQFKNAVEASYFSHCTSGLVPAGAHVVLIEVANNLFNYGDSASSLRKLLKAIRAVAPAAAIIFVNWLRNPGGSEDVIERVASTWSTDVVRARAVMHHLSRRNLSKGPKRSVRNNGPLYADRGNDLAHPTTKGHALLGALAARHVARRIFTAGCAEGGPLHAGGETSGRWRAEDAKAATQAGAAGPPESTYELCYTRADHLPLIGASPGHPPAGSGWSLIDEGGAKAVPKLGLASWRVGDVLRLGPIPNVAPPVPNVEPPIPNMGASTHNGGALVGATRPSCGVTLAQLGYLMKRGGQGYAQGAIEISCVGSCFCVRKGRNRHELAPFPIVKTDSALAADPTVRYSNLTVTAVTSFLILWSREQATAERPCAVHLTHLAANPTDHDHRGNTGRARPGRAGPAVRSRVRVDSLVLQHFGYPPDKAWNYAINHWSMPPNDKQTMRRFLERHGGKCA